MNCLKTPNPPRTIKLPGWALSLGTSRKLAAAKEAPKEQVSSGCPGLWDHSRPAEWIPQCLRAWVCLSTKCKGWLTRGLTGFLPDLHCSWHLEDAGEWGPMHIDKELQRRVYGFPWHLTSLLVLSLPPPDGSRAFREGTNWNTTTISERGLCSTWFDLCATTLN